MIPSRLQHVDTRIGERCQIGVGAVIYPGVKVGDGCIVAPGAVVMRDVAAGCVVVGNPARVVEKDIRTGKYGVRLDAAALGSPRSTARRAGEDATMKRTTSSALFHKREPIGPLSRSRSGLVEREPNAHLIVEFIACRCLHVGCPSGIASGEAS